MSDGDIIRLSDLPLERVSTHGRRDPAGINTLEPMPLDRLIQSYTKSILNRFENNRSRAADVLKITRQRLRRILNSPAD